MMPNPLQLVQDECNRLAAKYKLRAYVRTKPSAVKGDEWKPYTLCQVIVEDKLKIEIMNEWANFGNKRQLHATLEESFHAMNVRNAARALHGLVVASRR